MITKLIPVDRNKVENDRGLREAAEALRRGELVAFPTETVYGLGASAFDEEAILRIYLVKGRPQDNPLIVHLARLEDLSEVATNIPELAYRLYRKFSPGPLTLVLPRHPHIPARVSAGLDTVAVRFPEDAVARELIRLAGVPVVAPSANLSGKPSPTTAAHCLDDLDGKVPFIVDGGPCRIGLESTVLDLCSDEPHILRPGAITAEMLDTFLGRHQLEEEAAQPKLKKGEIPKAPGMKYRHYAPRARVVILPVEATARAEMMAAFREHWSSVETKKMGGFLDAARAEETLKAFPEHFFTSLRLYDKGAEGGSAGLFAAFRDFDKAGVECILVDAQEEKGAGAAYMNRLKKAAAPEKGEALPGDRKA